MRKFAGFVVLMALPAAVAAAPYPTETIEGFDPYASEAIARGELGVAEARLERRIDEQGADAPSLLNMAAIMVETNRMARAASLYRSVLEGEDMLLEAGDGSAISAHAIASEALNVRVQVGSR
ncbi:MAG: hypothetical protein RLN87_10970 [Parasphingopyxis sp.]|uniref:hypothetical protein n=1 Tax=Parasphingopyxis sp. TaxID=1920299 RepID=UPI0032F06BFE